MIEFDEALAAFATVSVAIGIAAVALGLWLIWTGRM